VFGAPTDAADGGGERLVELRALAERAVGAGTAVRVRAGDVAAPTGDLGLLEEVDHHTSMPRRGWSEPVGSMWFR
jgi:hypothetical protein